MAVESKLEENRWTGGVQPFAVSHRKMGMWLFLLSDSLTFAALLFGYAYLRDASSDWPQPFHLMPSIVSATAMTFVLLASSLTMVLAVRAARRDARTTAVRWLLATMACGILFLILHLAEWRTLIALGMTARQNPWGDSMFGGTFFVLTGTHMLHVFCGVVYLGILALRLRRRASDAESIEVGGLYWHFVDLVWMFLFPLVYLLSMTALGGGTP